MTNNSNWLDELIKQIGYGRLGTQGGYSVNSQPIQILEQQQQPQQEKKDSSSGMSYDQAMDMVDQFSNQGSGGGYSATTESTMWGNEFTAGMDTGGGSYGTGGGASSGGGAGGSVGGGGSGGSGGGMGGSGVAAIIAAVIAAQMAMTNNSDTRIKGEKPHDMFTFNDGHYEPGLTEPWRGYLHDKLGWEPTAGEKFDAALWSGEASEGERWRSLPAAADYYADPIRSWLGYDTWYNLLGEWSDNEDVNKVIATLIDPIGGILNQIEDWF